MSLNCQSGRTRSNSSVNTNKQLGPAAREKFVFHKVLIHTGQGIITEKVGEEK